MFGNTFWQQPCEAGIRICPHSFFMMWQQARSAALICASGAMQATTGDKQMTFNSNSAPRLDKNFTIQHSPSKVGFLRDLRKQVCLNTDKVVSVRFAPAFKTLLWIAGRTRAQVEKRLGSSDAEDENPS